MNGYVTDAENNKTVKPCDVIALILNIVVVAGGIYADIQNFKVSGVGMLKFYTVESNIFAQIACSIYSFALINKMKSGKRIPLPAVVLKFAAVCVLSVTFLVVIFILAPMFAPYGYKMMLFGNTVFFHHLLCPVAAFVSFAFFEEKLPDDNKLPLFAAAPTFVYAVITTLLNIMKVLVGPYPFLMVYKQSPIMSVIWFVLIVGGAYGFAFLLWKMKRNK